MHQRLMATVALAAVMCVAGCQKKNEVPPAEQKAAALDSSAVAPSPLTGTWTIVAHHRSEISAMSDAEAAAWNGRTLRLSATEVAFGDVDCDNPSFAEITLSRDAFLGMDASFPPSALMKLADVDPLTLVNVSCGGSPLPALGRLIIEIDSDHILAPWESVFFELVRAPAP